MMYKFKSWLDKGWFLGCLLLKTSLWMVKLGMRSGNRNCFNPFGWLIFWTVLCATWILRNKFNALYWCTYFSGWGQTENHLYVSNSSEFCWLQQEADYGYRGNASCLMLSNGWLCFLTNKLHLISDTACVY